MPLDIFFLSRRKYLRSLIRGYANVQRSERGIGGLRELRNQLVDVVLTEVGNPADIRFWGSAAYSSELAVRQFAIERYAGTTLNKSIFFTQAMPAIIALIFTLLR